MPFEIPALSIRQPWGEFILNGLKTIELRTWSTDYRGRVLLHVGQKKDDHPMNAGENLFTGGYIGLVEISAVVPMDSERWNRWRSKHLDQGNFIPGYYGWVMSNPKRFKNPVTGPGQLKLFLPSGEKFSEIQFANPDIDFNA